MSEVKKGTVKFFNGSYGFIEQSDGQKDIYFNKSGINIGVKVASQNQTNQHHNIQYIEGSIFIYITQ